MDAFLASISAFPTMVFTVLMGVAFLYWLLVIAGALDIDILHADGDAGAHHGSDHDSHAGTNPNAVLEFLRVGQVPLTIIASSFVFWSWSTSLLATSVLKPLLPDWSWWLFGGVALVGALVVGYLATGVMMRPLAKVFSIQGEHAADDLIGRVVEVTSTTVDERFGQARHDRPSGEDLILNVSAESRHALKRGEQAVILEYDRAAGVYRIAPLPHTRPGFLPEPNPADADPVAVAVSQPQSQPAPVAARPSQPQ